MFGSELAGLTWGIESTPVVPQEVDGDLGLYATSEGPFWVGTRGQKLSGGQLLRFLIKEHQWMLKRNPRVPFTPEMWS